MFESIFKYFSDKKVFYQDDYQIIKKKEDKNTDILYYYSFLNEKKDLVKIKKIYKNKIYSNFVNCIEEYNPNKELIESRYFKYRTLIGLFKDNRYKYIKYGKTDISDYINNILFNNVPFKGYIIGLSYQSEPVDIHVISLPDSKIEFDINNITYYTDGISVDKVKIGKIFDSEMREYNNVKIDGKWYFTGEVYCPKKGIDNIRMYYNKNKLLEPYGIYQDAEEDSVIYQII